MRLLAWSAMVLAGLLAHGLAGGWLGRPVAPDLALLPERLGPLERGALLPVAEESLGEVPPERHAFGRLVEPDGSGGNGGNGGVFFVAYYERGRRWSGRPHDVAVCYRADGWTPLSAERVRAPDGAPVWIRAFRRGERTIRVVHWLQRPTREASTGLPSWLGRLVEARGVRQDVASIYFEFDEATAPPRADLLEAVAAMNHALERLWRPDRTAAAPAPEPAARIVRPK